MMVSASQCFGDERSLPGIAQPHTAGSRYWDNFDSVIGSPAQLDGDDTEGNDSDFDLPDDQCHRPVTSCATLPHFKPTAVVRSEKHKLRSPATPPRGRTRQRQEFTSELTTSSTYKSCASMEAVDHFSPRISEPHVSINPFGSPSAKSSKVDQSLWEHGGLAEHAQLISHEMAAEDEAFDLKAPPPANLLQDIEYLSERLFSADHLKVILKEPSFSTRFVSFLRRYHPDSEHALQYYTSVQKAITAVEYANALAESLGGPGSSAATLADGFELETREAVDELVNDVLPGYITHRLVQLVTDILVKEITGQSTPIMRELVAGLAEVYCLTDPTLQDNPIVYASEEFHRCTQYAKGYVIGRNCRFLQGPKSHSSSVQRLADALTEGYEICEVILNYRRDGSPFMNLLMISPLYDNKGAVRYFIGAQIDVSGLIEGGRGLDSFAKLLAEDRGQSGIGGQAGKVRMNVAARLRELASMLDEKDLDTLFTTGPAARARKNKVKSGQTVPMRARSSTARRFVGMDDPDDEGLWPSASFGISGRLPGVFQNYLLVRPYPSLRITFTSPTLRIPGLLQSRLLDRIGGSAKIRDQLLDALSSGIGVTARVRWLPNAHDNGANGNTQFGPQVEEDLSGKTRWIHCTPLFGSDGKIGVWMIVMVENESVTGSLNASEERGRDAMTSRTIQPHRSLHDPLSAPHAQSTNGSSQQGTGNVSVRPQASVASKRSHKMYQEYLRREGYETNGNTTAGSLLYHRDHRAPTTPDGRDSIKRARDGTSTGPSTTRVSLEGCSF